MFKPAYHNLMSGSNKSLPNWSNLIDSCFQNDLSGFGAYPINTYETDEAYKVEIAAPGFEKENFSLKIEGNYLTIKAETKEEKEQKDVKYTRKEFTQKSFSKTFSLPSEILTKNILAEYKNGLLLLSIPKTKISESKDSFDIKVS